MPSLAEFSAISWQQSLLCSPSQLLTKGKAFCPPHTSCRPPSLFLFLSIPPFLLFLFSVYLASAAARRVGSMTRGYSQTSADGRSDGPQPKSGNKGQDTAPRHLSSCDWYLAHARGECVCLRVPLCASTCALAPVCVICAYSACGLFFLLVSCARLPPPKTSAPSVRPLPTEIIYIFKKQNKKSGTDKGSGNEANVHFPSRLGPSLVSGTPISHFVKRPGGRRCQTAAVPREAEAEGERDTALLSSLLLLWLLMSTSTTLLSLARLSPCLSFSHTHKLSRAVVVVGGYCERHSAWASRRALSLSL